MSDTNQCPYCRVVMTAVARVCPAPGVWLFQCRTCHFAWPGDEQGRPYADRLNAEFTITDDDLRLLLDDA